MIIHIQNIITSIFEWFSETDNRMFSIILAFVPAILGISYPILIQTISRLNDMYQSTNINGKFKKEFIHNAFKIALITSTILVVLSFIGNLILLLVAFLSVISLLVVFFCFVELLIKYLDASELFEWYIKRTKIDKPIKKDISDKKIKKLHNKYLSYWHPIVDLLTYSIQHEKRDLENYIKSEYIVGFLVFVKRIEQKNNKFIDYPDELYNSFHDITITYLKNPNYQYNQQVESFIGTMLFPDSYYTKNHSFLHYKTYQTIWRNLVYVIENQRMDLIKRFFERSHQYCWFELNNPNIEYDKNYNEKERSVEYRELVEQQRLNFIEFHTALGAYLLYKHEYVTLNYLWRYTQSVPASYFLFPESLGTLLDLYYRFYDDDFYKQKVVIQYWFKDLNYEDFYIKESSKIIIQKYIGLLFLRLYLTNPNSLYFSVQNFSRVEIQIKIRMIDLFKEVVTAVLQDSDIVDSFNLSIINEDFCKEKNLKLPLVLIDDIKNQLEETGTYKLKTSELNLEKIDGLVNNATISLREALNDIKRIAGSKDIEGSDKDKVSEIYTVIRGTTMFFNREAFIDDSIVHYIGSEDGVANKIKFNYYTHFIRKLELLPKTRKLIVPHGRIFDAIAQLNPSHKRYIIITFNLDVDYYINNFNAVIDTPSVSTENEDYRFNETSLYNIKFSFRKSPFQNTVYLLNVNSKPMVKHRDWTELKAMPEDIINYWKNLESKDKNLKLYYKISDLNNDTARKEVIMKKGYTELELENKVEFIFDFLAYIWFDKKIDIIEISEAMPFQEGGDVVEIRDIEPL